MGENKLILIRVVASCLTGPTEELLWTADPLVEEEGTLKLLGMASWLFFTGGGLFGGVDSAGITLGKWNTNPWPPDLCIGNFKPSFLPLMRERPMEGLDKAFNLRENWFVLSGSTTIDSPAFPRGVQDGGTPLGGTKLNCTPSLATCFLILTPLELWVLIEYISILTILPTSLGSFFCKISNKQSKQARWLIWQVGHFTTVSKGLAGVQTETQAWVVLIPNHSLVWMMR